MFKKIRQSQPGPNDPHPQSEFAPRLAVPDAGVHQDGPRSDLAATPEDRQRMAEEPGALARLAADVTRQVLTPEQDSETKRRRRLLSLRVDLHKRLLEELNLAAIDKVSQAELKSEISQIVREELFHSDLVLSRSELDKLCDELVDEVTGLGPLEPLLKDNSITDILVNTFANCYVERNGVLDKTDVQFKDDAHLMRVINKIVSAVGRRVDESQPWVDARLADGSRVNAMVPPCAVDGPLLSIRKFSKIPFTVDSLISGNSFSEEMALYLHACVRCKLNILVSGGTGSGKTTTLNALSSFIPANERIVTIEDTAELAASAGTCRPDGEPARPIIEGSGAVTQRDLLKQRAAYAAGPDHRRRDPWRRGHRHAPGDEHRP